jgi:hypothetical protein
MGRRHGPKGSGKVYKFGVEAGSSLFQNRCRCCYGTQTPVNHLSNGESALYNSPSSLGCSILATLHCSLRIAILETCHFMISLPGTTHRWDRAIARNLRPVRLTIITKLPMVLVTSQNKLIPAIPSLFKTTKFHLTNRSNIKVKRPGRTSEGR